MSGNANEPRGAAERWHSGLNVAAHATLFLSALALYALTLNGDVQPADSGEFQIAAIMLGIPHPPGYPLFTMLGWLFAQVPVGSPYARVSFLSAVASAFTLVMVSLTVQRVLSMRPCSSEPAGRGAPLTHLAAGLLAAIALGSSTTFWAQATTTNIRSLTAFFTALMLFTSASVYVTGRAAMLPGFALAFGLGVGHHLSLLFVGALLGAHALHVVWRSDRRGFRHGAAMAFGVLIATQLIWLYLPIRDAAGARFAPGNLTTLDGLLFHIFARGFAGDMLAFAAPEFLFDRLALLPTLLTFQFSSSVLLGMALALPATLGRLRGLGVVWMLACIAHLFITITYRAPQTVEYAMPAWVILCVTLGAGLGAFAEIHLPLATERRTIEKTIPRAALLVPLLGVMVFAGRDGVQRWPSFAYLSRDRSTRTAAESVLRGVQRNAVILSQWHEATPLWALQDIEGLRRDVRVEYVFPHGAQPYAETFAEQAARHARAQPTYVTSLFADEFAKQGLHTIPLRDRPAWRVTHSSAPPIESDGTLFDERIVVLGPSYLNGRTFEAGQTIHMDVGWHVRAAPQPGDSVTVRLLRPDGRLATNADLRLPADAQAGDHAMQRVALGLPLDLPPGVYDIWVGAYRPAEGGFVQYRDRSGAVFVSVGKLTIAPASFPPATQHPLGDASEATLQQPQLIGVDYDTGIAGQLRAWTHWRLGRSAMEVTLVDGAGRPLAPSQRLGPATALDRAQFLSLAFDIPPVRGMRVLPLNRPLPDYCEGQRYVPFADRMILLGANAHEGATLKLDIHWLAARPLVNDYVISVRVEGDGMYRTHDSVPALGAIPTLKWIRGSRVIDRHPFDLGDYRGQLRANVVVYDSVNRLPLPPLDERYDNGVSMISFQIR